MSGGEGTGNDLQECRLTTPIWANNAYCGSSLNFEGQIAQSPEFSVPAQSSSCQRFFEAIARVVVNAILLRYVFHAQRGGHGQQCSRIQEMRGNGVSISCPWSVVSCGSLVLGLWSLMSRGRAWVQPKLTLRHIPKDQSPKTQDQRPKAKDPATV